MSRNQKAPLLVFVLVAMICTLVVVDSMRVDAGDRDLVLGARSPGVAGSETPGSTQPTTPEERATHDVDASRDDSAPSVDRDDELDTSSGSAATGSPSGSPSTDDGTAVPQPGTGSAPLLAWGSAPSGEQPDGPAGDGTEALPESGPPTQGPSTHEGLEPEQGERPDLPGRGLTAVSPPVPVPVVPDPTSTLPSPPATPLTPGAQPPSAEPLCRERARRHPPRRALQPCR
ncbi:hypothetical protein [Nocardioides nanhaiensis]|uniref:Uncharacterized protein n=1 Tax=Nocardioides nanhaiensis TaxID=1476871 RepID=A0ABP8WWT2_9ACTN